MLSSLFIYRPIFLTLLFFFILSYLFICLFICLDYWGRKKNQALKNSLSTAITIINQYQHCLHLLKRLEANNPYTLNKQPN